MHNKDNHLFGVEFYLKRDNISRYCEVITKSQTDIFNVLQKIYDDLGSINEIDDQGECDEDGELICKK